MERRVFRDEFFKPAYVAFDGALRRTTPGRAEDWYHETVSQHLARFKCWCESGDDNIDLYDTFVASTIEYLSNRYGRTSARSPVIAEYLFYLFMDAQKCDALVGDLEERYKLIHKKFGQRRANFWYWTQALSSVLPIVWAWAKKVVMKPVVAAITWAAARHLLKDNSWLVIVAEVWKRIRS